MFSINKFLKDIFGFYIRFESLFETNTEMSNKEIYLEPFLDDELIVFQNVFTLMDPAYNTSEIKPIMLSIPKSMRSKMKSAIGRPSQSSLSNNQNGNANNATIGGNAGLSSVLNKGRLLVSSTLTNKINNDNTNSNANTNNNNDTNHGNSKRQHNDENSSSRPVQQTNIGNEYHVTLDPIIERFIEDDQQFWLTPVPSKRTASFHLLIEKNKTNTQFKLFFDTTKQFLMRATLDGSSFNDNLTVFIKQSQQYHITSLYDGSSDCYFATLSENGKRPTEFCAAKFTKQNVFDLFIPALKKNKETGKSYMAPIAFGGLKSTLLEKFNEGSHESIKIQSRANDGTNVDLTFSGRFITNDPTNFILYHKSNQNKDIISCGPTDDTGYYMLNISYPMNTIQGFFAAIAAHLTNA
ncbi:hypothetical protein TRFO_29720 [Tritrichomonas foetus]|uniref:Tubby C-terminal domain-containing protein n=1 Tax=Tritrichomonas foetus TaxID=1144522 RepID=A0A1J4K0G9_9EUKA|nr:hypothetical protein TRFO_29720 [Tritrichomonas foetus]|eukprot:OHT03013.1 hypothetical protein TRFO_29720 [Tritrichomonas foetus]